MKLARFFIFLACFLFMFFPVYLIQVGARILFLLVVSAALFSYLPKKNLFVSIQQNVTRAFLFEKTQIKLYIHNNSIFPILNLGLRDLSNGLQIEGKNQGVFFLAPKSKVCFEYSIWSMHRGLFELGPVFLSASDPLGLFPWENEYPLQRLVFIYPRLSPLDFTAKYGQTGGPIQSEHPMYLDTSQIRSIREYEPGDDTRFIHWKASASLGKLMTSEYAKTLNVPFYVLLNLNEKDYHQKRKGFHIERCIEAAAAFIELASQKMFALGFSCNGLLEAAVKPFFGFTEDEDLPFFHMPIAKSSELSSEILSVLSVIKANPKALDISILAQNLKFHLHPHILIISPPLNPESYENIISVVPRTCSLDFWFLDEHQNRETCVDHRKIPHSTSTHIYKLPEYGEDLLNKDQKNEY